MTREVTSVMRGYEETHGRFARWVWSAIVTRDGLHRDCGHYHRTPAAAERCASKLTWDTARRSYAEIAAQRAEQAMAS